MPRTTAPLHVPAAPPAALRAGRTGGRARPRHKVRRGRRPRSAPRWPRPPWRWPGRRPRTWSAARSGRRRAPSVDERRRDAGAAGPERVADRDRAAVDVDLVEVDAGLALPREDDGGEGLVDLEQ